MKKQIFAFLLLSACILPAELFSQGKTERVLGSFVHKDKLYDYQFLKTAASSFSLNITTTKKKADSEDDSPSDTQNLAADVPAADSNDGLATFFNEFSKETFTNAFNQQMLDKFEVKKDQLTDLSTELFFKIQARLEFSDDQPITAYLILKKDSIRSYLRTNRSPYYRGVLSWVHKKQGIELVSVETEDGTIKNITAYISSLESEKSSIRNSLEFKNRAPISISGKFDPDNFAAVNLYCDNCGGISGLSRFIKLSDLLKLDIVYENGKEDFSPADDVITLDPFSPIKELRKERRSRILEVAGFTDFVGLDRDEPNGLVQIEAKRKILIHTKSYRKKRFGDFEGLLNRYNLEDIIIRRRKNEWGQFVGYEFAPKSDTTKVQRIRNTRHTQTYYGFLTYIEPRLLFAKIEENNQLVDSAKAVGGIIDPMSLYRQQLSSFGINIQLFRISYPQLKFQWNILNVGGYWFRTRVATSTDTVTASKPLNSHYWDINSTIIFRPDSRWGATAGCSYLLMKIWDPAYKLTSHNGAFQAQFDAFLKTNSEAKLFFRYRWTYENKNRNNNFTQIQLGYLMNLFAVKGDEKKK